MHVAGIVAEYNPFHEGHLHLIRKIREELGDKTPVVIIMSGEFVQRGEPSLIDRTSRTCAVLSCGADLVFELPFTFACGSADRFAHGAIRSLIESNGITDLYFGAEHDSLSDLSEIARIDFEKEESFQLKRDELLKEGLPYAAAWEGAALSVLSTSENALSPGLFSSIVGKPNNLLAIAYLRELFSSENSITPHLIVREGSYSDPNLQEGAFPSATAIRERIRSHLISGGKTQLLSHLDELRPYLPDEMLSEMLHLWHGSTRPMGEESLLSSVLPILRSMSSDDLSGYAYMGNGLAGYLKNSVSRLHFDPNTDLPSLFRKKIATKCFSYTRIMRAISSLVIGQKEEDLMKLSDPCYLRLLGFSERGRGVLKEMRSASTLPILSRASDAFHHGKDPVFSRMDELDRVSHDWWTQIARGTWEEDFHQEVIQFKRNKLYR